MILMQAQHIARHFGSDVLFENVYMEIQDNARIALVGRNGAGKSTLLKILAGLEEPDEGVLSKTKETTIGYLSQHTGLESTKTIWEEMLVPFTPLLRIAEEMRQIESDLQTPALLEDSENYAETLTRYDKLQHQFQSSNGYSYESEIRSVLNGFSFYEEDYHTPVDHLSGGQKTRLALARILLEKKDLLILDEPTNHLDIETLAWLEGYLQSYTGALLIVSHDRYFLDSFAKEVYELSRQKMTHYKGNYTSYMDQKAANLAREWKEFEKQQKEISKLEDFVARNLVRASTTKRAQSRRKQLEKMDRLDKPQGDERSARFHFIPDIDSGNIVLQAEHLAVGYDHEPLSTGIQLDLRKQDAIALVGPNGIGKSTLLKTLIGKIPPIEGTYSYGTKVETGYYDQQQSDLHSTKSVLMELWDEHPTVPEKEIRSLLGSFLFTGEDVKKAVSSLSGGEKARLALSKLAMQHDNFLMLDEPTNHLDLDSKEVLEEALIEFPGSLFFVSHDRYFINRIATKVLELTPEGTVLYLGDYDYYLAKKAEIAEIKRLEEEKQAPKRDIVEEKSDNQEDRLFNKQLQKKIRQLERDIAALEEQLEQMEQTIDQLEEQLSHPDVFSDPEKAAELGAEVERIKTRQEKRMLEWEEKSLEMEEIR